MCEVITDKLVAKIPSSYSGKIVKLNFKNDEICQVGQSLLDMEVGDDVKVKEEVKEEPAAAPEPPKAEAPKPEPTPAPVAPKQERVESGQVLATPAVRGLATEMKIDLAKVTPTGKGGRITKNDVLKYAESIKSGPTASAASSAPSIPTPTPITALEHDRTVKLAGLRQSMAQNMTQSLSIPPYNLQEEICVDRVNAIRKAYSKANPKMKINYMPFFIKAFSRTMLEFPVFNAVTMPNTDSDGYITDFIEKAEHNFTIPIDTPEGILMPNIKSVQNKSILQINEDIRALVERGRKGALTQEDLSDGTFTVSSIGGIGGLTGTPVIYAPQVAIVGLCRVRQVGVFAQKANGSFELKPSEIMGVTMSCDHRIIDGATGARFMTIVKNYIEKIDSLLLHLQ